MRLAVTVNHKVQQSINLILGQDVLILPANSARYHRSLSHQTDLRTIYAVSLQVSLKWIFREPCFRNTRSFEKQIRLFDPAAREPSNLKGIRRK